MMNKIYEPNDKSNNYYISHNPLLNETALVVGDTSDCRILEGDFVEEFLEVIDNGYDAVNAVFEKHRDEHEGAWSSAPPRESEEGNV